MKILELFPTPICVLQLPENLGSIVNWFYEQEITDGGDESVPLNTTDKTRYSLAFNVVPTIGFGDEGNLTELKF